MIDFAIRLLLMAVVFQFVLPMIHGITVSGNFGNALGLAIFFTIMMWLVSFGAKLLFAVLTIGTLGLALIVLLPVWLLGFWILPALALKLVADLAPAYLSINGWGPAIWGGLVMFFVGVATDYGNMQRHREERRADR